LKSAIAEALREKIDLAAAQLDRGEGLDYETATSQLRGDLLDLIGNK